jgi:hypothetical protein
MIGRLKEACANEVVLMRVVGADKRPFTEVRAGLATGVTELRHFDTLVSVETLVCCLNRDEVLWSSTSRTTNPESACAGGQQCVIDISIAPTHRVFHRA